MFEGWGMTGGWLEDDWRVIGGGLEVRESLDGCGWMYIDAEMA